MGKAVLKFEVPMEIECPCLYNLNPNTVSCSIGKMHNDLGFCVNSCYNKDKSIAVKQEDSKLKRGDRHGIRPV